MALVKAEKTESQDCMTDAEVRSQVRLFFFLVYFRP